MNFDSVFFISCFLPVAAVLYWVIPGLRGKNALLLVFSLLFYFIGKCSEIVIRNNYLTEAHSYCFIHALLSI